MSKFKLSEINFDDDEILVEVDKNIKKESKIEKEISLQQEQFALQKEKSNQEAKKIIDEAQLVLNRAKEEAWELVEKAQKEASEIKEKLDVELEEKKKEILESAQKEASEIVQKAKEDSSKEASDMVEKSKEEIEQERVSTIKAAYEDGYKDGLEKIQEELEEKICAFDNFCKNQYEIRNKILKSANKDILDLIINISKKVLLKEIDASVLDKIIKSAISLFEKKENITIILSQKYAKILFEHQKKSLGEDIEFEFEDFKQYDNFDVVYNPDFDDDTIIVENLKERYDASLSSQLDVIIRNIYDNSQNGKIDLEQYENEAE